MRLACSEDSFTNLDEETLAALKAKHPFPHPDTQIPPLEEGFTLPTPVSEEVVAKTILSFPNGSAGGPDGLRPHHLKDLTSASAERGGKELLRALATFVNLVLKGL